MTTYKALVIDDEKANRELLTDLLVTHCPSITEVRQGASVKEGLGLIDEEAPDVLFLDIEMPGGSGFDLLNKLENIAFKVIFVTAYDSYALQAIKYSALDYLLKPIDPNELKLAVSKMDKYSSDKEKINILSHNLKNDSDRRVALSTQEEVIFVKLREIIHLQAEANYTRIFLENRPAILLSGNLGHFEKMFDDKQFYRTHQSHLINLAHVRKFVKTEGGYFEMSDNSHVPVARLKREEVRRMLLS